MLGRKAARNANSSETKEQKNQVAKIVKELKVEGSNNTSVCFSNVLGGREHSIRNSWEILNRKKSKKEKEN